MTDTSQAATLPVWDQESFDGFTDWMPRHRVEKLLDLFRKRAREAIGTLPGASDDAAWEKEAHDLLYSAGTLGFVRLAEACRRVQATIRRKETPTDADRAALLEALSGALEASGIAIPAAAP